MPKKLAFRKKPKRYAGAIVSAALELGTKAWEAVDKTRKAEQAKIKLYDKSVTDISRNISAQSDAYQDYIARHPELIYGTDKEIQAFGNDDPLKTITDGMQVIDAGSHESGNDVERRDDFVEGGEVVQGDTVHSNRIQAYSPAQMSASLGVVLDEISKISNRATGGTKGSLERLGAKFTQKIYDVTKKQEDIKSEYGFGLDQDGKVTGDVSSSTGDLDAIIGKPQNALGDEKLPETYKGIDVEAESRELSRSWERNVRD